ncbi:host specificity factor TipJ family phage tail protein [Advenella mimigardefordensis]|uniref:Uncharacterized protein n=1 Tax=Advenella mimigardefordensis (strain DSM 17166 / LMG 22922 / DPN7) TaxID=1247726 RepID=W0PCL8_ADVMD|nr:host specificity factor TipJ family phage tail protein [Advenella mimigardefordensis]AHG63197.1 hypothetical protein MIM_c10990 [Advenella mimigardefordensis DPN7]
MRVYLFDDLTDRSKCRELEYSCPAEFLLRHYGERCPSGKSVQMFDKEPSMETAIPMDPADPLSEDALLCDDYEYITVLESPGDPWTIGAAVVALVAAAVAISMAKKKVAAADNVDRGQSSDNNSLSDRSNKVRYNERIEDIVGKVLSVPSMVAPTYTKIDSNKQVRYEIGLYCVGRGYYEIQDVKEGDTLLSDITGSSAKFYDPFGAPMENSAPSMTVGDASWSEPVLQARRCEQFESIVLKAPNQVQLPNAVRSGYRFNEPGNDESATYSSITQTNQDGMANFSEIFLVGDQVEVSGAAGPDRPAVSFTIVQSSNVEDSFTLALTPSGILVGDTINVTGYILADSGLNGTYTVASITGNKIYVVENFAISSTQTATLTRPYIPPVTSPKNGTYDVLEVGDGYIVIDNTTWSGDEQINARVQRVGATEWTDWATLPDANLMGVIANLTANAGMYRNSAENGLSFLTTFVEMQYQSLDAATLVPTGAITTLTNQVDGASKSFRGKTLEIQGLTAGPRRIRFRRTNNFDYDTDDVIQDEVTLETVFACSPIIQANFGDVTLVYTKTEFTRQAVAIGERQLNMVASRKIPIYDQETRTWSGVINEDGWHSSGTLYPARDVLNIIPFVYQDRYMGNRPVSEIDMDSLAAAANALYAIHPDLPTCDYTFDDTEMSVENHLALIADAASMTSYRQYGKVRFEPDVRKDAPTMLFTHRNKKPASDVVTRTMISDGYDGIEFKYVSPTSVGSPYRTETIILPLDGNYTKLKSFEIPGFTGFAKSWLRANREYRKLMNQRQITEFGATNDARMLVPGSMMDSVDNTTFQSNDGEVMGVSGLTLTLSQPVVFTPGQTHYIVLMRRNGSLESIQCTPGATDKEVVLANLPSEPIVSDENRLEGIRTIYSFAADIDREGQYYTVDDIDPTDPEYIGVKGSIYLDMYYEMDYQPIPDETVTINQY